VTLLAVLVGGALGAPLRYLTDLWVQSRHDSDFPWGTFAVNAVGSAVLGVTAGTLVAGSGPDWVLPLVGIGFCGALTTFSTFGWETLRLLEDGSMGEAVLNSAGSVVVGLAACAGGWYLGATVF
jgi:CrcB protein